jgi:hypothetical protein
MSDNEFPTDAAIPVLLPLPEPARRRSRGRLALVGVALIAVLVAGLLAITSKDGKALTLAKSAALTQDQKTAKIEMTMALAIPGATSKTVTVSGSMDFTAQAAEFQVDLASVLAGQLGGLVSGTDFTATFITKGAVEYMRIPMFDMLAKLKGKWFKLDVGQLTKKAGVDIGGLTSNQNNDPSQILSLLTEKAKSVTTVGTEQIRGVSTTHRKVVIDLEAMYRSKSAVADEAAFQKVLAQFSTTDLTVDVWTDSSGLVRKLSQTMPLKTNPATFSVEFFEFGAPVSISIPAAADTVDFSALSQLTN